MRPFEYLYSVLQHFEHPLYQRVHSQLDRIARNSDRDVPVLLDVGGRKSNYTVGLPCKVWITDVPRATELQERLDLGATDGIMSRVQKRRSNVDQYLIDDMTCTSLSESSVDAVVAVEVIEHVEKDDKFIENIAKVLRSDGSLVITTPNGEEIPIPYPDHKRHYRRQQLADLLGRYFDRVDVHYCVEATSLFSVGLFRWSLKSPIRTLMSMGANRIAYAREVRKRDESNFKGKLHLFAICSAPKKAMA